MRSYSGTISKLCMACQTRHIARDRANEPAISRQCGKAGPALLHRERIVCEPEVAQLRLVAGRAHHVVQMRGVVAVTGRADRLIAIAPVRVDAQRAVQPRVLVAIAPSLE